MWLIPTDLTSLQEQTFDVGDQTLRLTLRWNSVGQHWGADVYSVIRQNKTAGTSMRGGEVVNVPVGSGTRPVRFDRPAVVACKAKITVNRLVNFTAVDAAGISAAVAALDFAIGEDVILSRLYTPINTVPGFWVSELLIGPVGGALGTANIAIDARSLACFAAADVQVVVSP